MDNAARVAAVNTTVCVALFVPTERQELGANASTRSNSTTIAIHQEGTVTNIVDLLRQRFQSLAAQWKRETYNMSSVAQIKSHPLFEDLVSLGSSIVPLAVEEIKHNDMMHFVLMSIVKNPPVFERTTGGREAIYRAWKEWQKSHLK